MFENTYLFIAWHYDRLQTEKLKGTKRITSLIMYQKHTHNTQHIIHRKRNKYM